MRKNVARYLIFGFLFLLLLKPSLATGVSPAKIELPFFPDRETVLWFDTQGYNDIDIEPSCPYIELNRDSIIKSGNNIRFSVTLKMPHKIDADPGKYNCGFMIREKSLPDMPRGVVARVEVGVVLNILIPYEGRYAKIKLEAPNTNKGEPLYFKVTVTNLGETDLNDLSAEIKVLNIKNETLKILRTTEGSAKKFGSLELWKKMETSDMEPARYKAVAMLNYGGDEPAFDETNFLIGKLLVNFVNMTRNATVDNINAVDVNVESWWGNPIEYVYAIINFKNESGVDGGTFKTVSESLQPWQTKTLRGYWDTNGLSPGKYIADIIVKYNGGEQHATSSIILNAKPEKVTLLTAAIVKAKSFIASTTFLLILIILFVVFNIALIVMLSKKRRR